MNRFFSSGKRVSLKENSAWLIFPVTMLLIFIMAARTPLDTDLWWHLRIGEASLQAGHPILIDQFSFTRFGVIWTNHHWLSQIALYGLYRIGGFLAIGAGVALLACASLGTVYTQMGEPALLRAFVIVLAGLVAAPVWVPRPELVTMVLLGVVGYLLYLFKWKHSDRLWLLVPIFIIWSNLHGGYIVGLALSGAMVAGELVNIILGFKGPEILPFNKILRLVGWSFLAGIAVLINPNGIRMWLIPFETVGINALQNYIVEWASPDFHQFIQQPFIWMLIATIAAIGLSMKRLDGTDLVTIVLFTYLGLVARRNFGPFSIVVAPILSRYLWSAITHWMERVLPNIRASLKRVKILDKLQATRGEEFVTARTRLINFGIVAFLVTVGIMKLYVVTSPVVMDGPEKASTPVDAVAWIQANHPEGNMFNSYNWGGYLLWSLRDYPVFVDGRTDLYSDEIINQWVQVVNATSGWQTVLDRWDINLILIEPSWPIIKILPSSGWKILYQDNISIIFGR
jgi:hypothetical protein